MRSFNTDINYEIPILQFSDSVNISMDTTRSKTAVVDKILMHRKLNKKQQQSSDKIHERKRHI